MTTRGMIALSVATLLTLVFSVFVRNGFKFEVLEQPTTVKVVDSNQLQLPKSTGENYPRVTQDPQPKKDKIEDFGKYLSDSILTSDYRGIALFGGVNFLVLVGFWATSGQKINAIFAGGVLFLTFLGVATLLCSMVGDKLTIFAIGFVASFALGRSVSNGGAKRSSNADEGS